MIVGKNAFQMRIKQRKLKHAMLLSLSIFFFLKYQKRRKNNFKNITALVAIAISYIKWKNTKDGQHFGQLDNFQYTKNPNANIILLFTVKIHYFPTTPEK